MKKLLYCLSILVGAWALTGCTEEEFLGGNPALIPNADDINASIVVDQTTNQFTLKLNNPGCYPIWRIYKSEGKAPTRSTVNGYTDIITIAGTYTVEVQMGNRNGICQGTKKLSFTLDNSIVDWTPYMTFLTGGDTKRWEMARKEGGHLGCGESGTDGLNWWAAGPDEKTGTGMYEAILQFGDKGAAPAGSYVLDPGTEGMIYCNKDVWAAPYGGFNPDNGVDYSVPFELRNSEFTFSMEGTDLYIEFPAGQTLPYLPSDYMLNNPRYRVQSLNRNKLELVSDEPGVIAWHYIFVPEGSQETPAEPKFEGFKFDSEFNLWKKAGEAGTISAARTWYADASWSEFSPAPEIESDGYSYYQFTLPYANEAQWQGQFVIDNTGISTSAASNYDFSCKVTVTKDHPGVTFKLCDPTNEDNVWYFADRVPVLSGEEFVFWKSDMPGLEIADLKLVLDFGGTAENNTIRIYDIVIKDHANDDGTVIPSQGGGEGGDDEDVSWVAVDSDANMWKNCSKAFNNWTADNNWSTIANPDATIEDDNSITVVYPETPGSSQWQAQVKIDTDLQFAANSLYDFHIVIEPGCDIPGATIKLTSTTDDGTFFTADRHDLNGWEDNVFNFVGMTGCDIADFQLCFDFAGVEANAPIRIKDIIIQKHVGWVDEDSDDNLWKNCSKAFNNWTADDGWGGIANPDATIEADNSITVVYPEKPGNSQWQAQVKIDTDLAFDANKAYDFHIVIEPDCDIPGATIKLTSTTDDGTFFTADRHDLNGWEDNEFSFKNQTGCNISDFQLCFDFAGVQANAPIRIKHIIIQEH